MISEVSWFCNGNQRQLDPNNLMHQATIYIY